MNRHHPIDLADRSHEWRAQGISQGTTDTSPYATGGTEARNASYQSTTSGQVTGSGFAGQGTSGDMSLMDREHMMDEQQGTSSVQGFGQQESSSEHDREMAHQGTLTGDQGTFQHDREMAAQEDYTGVGHGDWETRDVNRIVSGTSQGTLHRDYSSFQQEFRDHYMMIYNSRGQEYHFYEPGYRYGYDVANSDRYRGRRWSEIEPELQRSWQETNPHNPWDDFRDAVRFAWERTTSVAEAGGMTGSAGQDLGPSSSEDYGSGTAFNANNP
jgi:hypothetical protein